MDDKTNKSNNGDKENVDFTFSDIPILGVDKEAKESFSFEDVDSSAKLGSQHLNDSNPLSSFTRMLADTPDDTTPQPFAEPVEQASNNGAIKDYSLEQESQEDEEFDFDTLQDLNSTSKDLSDEYVTDGAQSGHSQSFAAHKRMQWNKILAYGKRKPAVKKAFLILAPLALICVIIGFVSLFFSSPVEPERAEVRMSHTSAKKRKKRNKKVTPPANIDKTKKTVASDKTDSTALVKERLKKTGDTPSEKDDKTEVVKDVNGKKVKPDSSVDNKSETDKVVKRKKRKIKTLAVYWGKVKEFLLEEDLNRTSKLYLEMLDHYHGRLSFQLKAQDVILKKWGTKLALEKIFGKWLEENPNSFEANYLYGKALGCIPVAAKYFVKSIQLKPDVADTYIALADIYNRDHKWSQAAKTYAKFLKIAPDNERFLTLKAIAWMRDGEGEIAINEYRNVLIKKDLSNYDIAAKLLPLAQRLPDSALSEKYLEDLKGITSKTSEYRTFNIIQQTLYGKLTRKDFSQYPSSEVRFYWILYLLSKGKDREVMLLQTPHVAFPDFWKTFLGWKADNKMWRENATRIISKYSKRPEKIYSIIAALWLGKISAKEARGLHKLVLPEHEPLLYFMLAEYYVKENKKTKARVLYVKALKYRPNCYRGLVEYYRKRLGR